MEVSRSEDDVGRGRKGERALLAEAVAEELRPVHDKYTLREAKVSTVPEWRARSSWRRESVGRGPGTPVLSSVVSAMI